MNQDIADNVLEKGKEGIKENFMEAFSEFANEYADEMWAIVNELIRVRNENQILREKKSPEKPVSLVEYTRIKDELRSKVDYIHEQDEIIKEYKDKIENGELMSTVQSEQYEQLKAENAELRARLDNAVELPCKVGDTVYCIRDLGLGDHRITEQTVSEIVFYYNNRMRIRTSFGLFDYEEWTFNVGCFTDREAAEAHLKELKGGMK